MTGDAARPAPAAVVVERYAFEYGDGTRALRDVSLTARAGEAVGLLGPNGCGKTTLLRAIARAGTRPVAGIDLRAISDTPSLVLDRPVFQRSLSGRANAVALLRMRGLSGETAAARAARALARFGLEDVADRPVSGYSRGTDHRLGLAIGFAAEASCTLLDEPLAGLDPAARQRLATEVRGAASAGRCVILSTHDPEFARTACDRVAFMADGRVLAVDRPSVFLDALSLETRIEIDPGAALEDHEIGRVSDLPDGVSGPTLEETTVVYRVADPARSLPGLLGVWLGAGLDVRMLRIREPDLRDAYFAVTGQRLERAGELP
ncbi:MAG: ABC transporter ATP-binding protein [Gemmatimonadota bacterium]|nr:ABC transporter ATP-binding protein [Gemmatimonadota bacterium]